jgi:hypothetical protein
MDCLSCDFYVEKMCADSECYLTKDGEPVCRYNPSAIHITDIFKPSPAPVGMMNVKYCTNCDNPTHDGETMRCKCGGLIGYDCVDDVCAY